MLLKALLSVHVVSLGGLVATDGSVSRQEVEIPAGFEHQVVAREPHIQDAVAFSVDPDGRLLVAETERTNRGAMDNRSSPWHLEDDLQSLTVEDRVAYMEKWAHKREQGMAYYTEMPDRVRRTIDSDGDGIYDDHTIFAGPFNDVADGIGAGVMSVGDEVWYTNIPHLWRLKDADGDGVAEIREPIQSGFGVRFALYGHDMHGLVHGPDGRIYWSIGDRGYHLVTDDGRVLADPRSGAVFRCERDGTNLEVYATGLRNPQELAFNDVGDLFTGDNTSDAGDRARIVYIAEHGETGWTMDYQSLEGANLRGPWEQERIWEVVTPENSEFRPDWTLPPLAHVGAGPSGFAYDPGVGLPEQFKDHFFMCDFTGSKSKSKVWTFQATPDGAGYRIVDPRIFVQGILNTDVDFDWNGRMLVSEWGGGWSSTRRGALHAITHSEAASDPRITEAREIAAGGFEDMSSFDLADLLGHPARRLRLMAQYELSDRGESDLLVDIARYETDRHARLHAIWGLSEIARRQAARNRRVDGLVAPLLLLLDDADPEVRAQAAKMLGEPAQPKAVEPLVARLADDSLRVRYHAAMSLGRIGDPTALPYLVAMLAENDDRDRFLRHAGVMALVMIGDRSTIQEMASSPAPSLRRAAVLALRRLRDPSIERLLFDPDPRIRTEAARAVHDLPIPEAMPALASVADEYRSVTADSDGSDLVVRREVFRIDRDHGGSDLLELDVFEGQPDSVEQLPAFEGPSDDGDRYVSRLTARLIAPQSGEYRFFIASDDGSVLRASTTGREEELVSVASVSGYVGRGRWDAQPGQQSEPIVLESGQEILLEARHAEGGGGDHLAVAWSLPDGTFEGPIGISRALHPSETPLLRRVVDANLRGGTPEDLERLAALAMNSRLPGVIRDEAMQAIASFDEPRPRDRVLGWWRPVEEAPRDVESFRGVLTRTLPSLSDDPTPSVRSLARVTASRLGVALDPRRLREMFLDTSSTVEDRIACFDQLSRIDDPLVPEAIDMMSASDDPRLRAAARDALSDVDPALAHDSYRSALESGTDLERQRAILGLGRSSESRSRALVERELKALVEADSEPTAWSVEVLEAAGQAGFAATVETWRAQSLEDPSLWNVALSGGDPEAGRRVARYHPGGSCLRCHVIEGQGGDAGPSLAGIGARSDRATILQSIVDPHAVIVDGYGDASAMPNMKPLLTPREVRDLVAYLATLVDEDAGKGH